MNFLSLAGRSSITSPLPGRVFSFFKANVGFGSLQFPQSQSKLLKCSRFTDWFYADVEQRRFCRMYINNALGNIAMQMCGSDQCNAKQCKFTQIKNNALKWRAKVLHRRAKVLHSKSVHQGYAQAVCTQQGADIDHPHHPQKPKILQLPQSRCILPTQLHKTKMWLNIKYRTPLPRTCHQRIAQNPKATFRLNRSSNECQRLIEFCERKVVCQ